MVKAGFKILILLLFIIACTSHGNKRVERGFYYWRTEFKLTGENGNILNKLGVRKLYIRFFDVSIDKSDSIPHPVQPVVFKEGVPDSIEVVPVIFITNETLQKLDSDAIPRLAKNIAVMITDMVKLYLKREVNEVQLDCDWSTSTKQKYFSLIRNIRPLANQNHWILSATIRLFQEKYPGIAGVPPVDRGTLMVYNMRPINDVRVKNSIIELDEEKKYLSNLDKYPLKLDVVLPIFYWGVLFRRGIFAGILNNLPEKTLKENVFFQHVHDNFYEARNDVELGGAHIEKDDIIRLEECNEETLESSIKLLASKNQTDTLTFSFFSLDSLLVNRIGYEKMEHYYSMYR